MTRNVIFNKYCRFGCIGIPMFVRFTLTTSFPGILSWGIFPTPNWDGRRRVQPIIEYSLILASWVNFSPYAFSVHYSCQCLQRFALGHISILVILSAISESIPYSILFFPLFNFLFLKINSFFLPFRFFWVYK